jgi:hypothetical protein
VQVDLRLDEVVLRTLEKEPQRRYQHASEVKTDVEAIDAAAPAAAPASPAAAAAAPPPPPPPPPPAAPPPGAPDGKAREEGPQAAPGTKPRRPRGVTWVAAYAFVYGASFLFGAPAFGFGFLGPDWARHGLPQIVQAVIGIAGIVAGVGLLDMRRWGRKAALVLATFGLLYFPLWTFASILVIVYLRRAKIQEAFVGPRGPAARGFRAGMPDVDRAAEKVADKIEELGGRLRGRPRDGA